MWAPASLALKSVYSFPGVEPWGDWRSPPPISASSSPQLSKPNQGQGEEGASVLLRGGSAPE